MRTTNSLRFHSLLILLVMIASPARSQSEAKPRGTITFLEFSLPAADQEEIRSAVEFLKGVGDIKIEVIKAEDFIRRGKPARSSTVIWIHRPDSSTFTKEELNPKLTARLKDYVDKGGRLLLTQQAIHYLNILGFETAKIGDSTKQCFDNGFGRRLGFHAFRNHPVFDGLHGGAYILWPESDMTARISGFFGSKVPATGKVVAVDWDYIFLREQTKLVIEYHPGKGAVLAVGGYISFKTQNRNRRHLELFMRNCLNYLADPDQDGHYWDYAPASVTECGAEGSSCQLTGNAAISTPGAGKEQAGMQENSSGKTNTDTVKSTAVKHAAFIASPSKRWMEDHTDLTLSRAFATENFWDVAGERMVTMGIETGGIEEIWAHPFMALRDYEIGIRFSYRDTILWLNDERPEISVTPAAFARLYRFQRAWLRETMVNDPVKPVGVIHYEYRGVYDATLVIRFKSNLRRMWPYSERVTGSICHRWDPLLQATCFRDGTGDLNVIIGGNKHPAGHLEGRFDSFRWLKADSVFEGIATDKVQAAGLLQYSLGMNENLDIVYSASASGFDSACRDYLGAIGDPEQIYRNASQHTHELLTSKLMITTPDSNFNIGYRWALLSTDRFMVNTPDMGRALVAGYSTTRFGWDGGHKVNGRPGYAWYFGRDAEWSGFALLDYGDFENVKAQLQFFNRYQDLTGKIFHEASTSGFLHYDAADATPLYLVLAGRYFRYSNDTAFLRKSWPNIRRAIDYCFSTDTDKDHLIENTNVGHGWVEGGELYGSHATIYMAGAWSAALTEAANMAGYLNDSDAGWYLNEAREVKTSVNKRFWSDSRRFYAYGMNKDGSFRWDPTVLPAVPVYFGLADREKAAWCTQQYASNYFTTNWGVRIIRDDSRMFKPTGYHYGSVWPLFTGWTSLAEYKSGSPVQGFSHLMNNLNVYKNWGLGFVEEVLNGSEYKPSGVCAHQCWSETMVLQPAIEGLLGLNVDAGQQRLTLAPALPADWDSIDVDNIRLADRKIAFNYRRVLVQPEGNPKETQHRDETDKLDRAPQQSLSYYNFSVGKGGAVAIEFMPAFPAGTQFSSVTLNGKEVPYSVFKTSSAALLHTTFQLNSSAQLIVKTSGGISVIPVVDNPKPGEPAEGFRIISSVLQVNNFQTEVENTGNNTGIISIWSQAGNVKTPENARLVSREGNISRYAIDFEPSTLKYVRKILIFKIN